MRKILLLTTTLLLSSNAFASSEPEFELVKKKYVGNGTFQTKFVLKNGERVSQIALDNKEYYCFKNPEKMVLKKDNLSFETNLVIRKPVASICNDVRNDFKYDSVIVQYENGDMDNLKPFLFYTDWERVKNELDVGNIEAKFINEKDAGIYRNSYGTKLESKIVTYEIKYKVSAQDLTDMRGVIFENGEEFLSENPEVLANYINTRKHLYQVHEVQKTNLRHIGCIPGGCMLTLDTPIKNQFKVETSSQTFNINFIRKGDISTLSTKYKIFENK